MKRRAAVALSLSILILGCGGPGADGADAPGSAGLSPDARDLVTTVSSVDPAIVEGWKQELIEADEAFSAAVSSEGLGRWGSFFTDDGAVVREGVGEIRGVEAVQAAMDEGAGAVIDFRWAPDRAEVSGSGDLGYTLGRSRILLMGPDNVEMVTTGMYVSIWRRQANGEWKVEMDLGNPITPPTPVPADETGTGDLSP